MKKLLTSVFTFISLFVNAQTIAEWNFNSVPNDLDLATGYDRPYVGNGLVTNIGFVTNSYEHAKGSSDPAQTDNTSYSTRNYPNTTENNKTSGIEIAVNTTGYSNIVLKFDLSCDPNAANEYVIQFSINGSNFTDYKFIKVDPPNDGVFVNHYIINASAITGLNNNPNTKFRIVSCFAENGNSYNAVNNQYEVYSPKGLVKFDMLSVAALSLLPVNISSFTGSYTNKTSLLKWTTANEINISKYTVERSEDGKTFTEIGFVNATGSTNYSYIDATAKATINFYRLRIIGVNEAKFSGIVKILSDAFTTKLNVYPSPAVNTVNAEFTSETKQMANVQFTDAGGKIILQKNTIIQQGYNNLAFDISILNKGMYILKITWGRKVVSASFNKL